MMFDQKKAMLYLVSAMLLLPACLLPTAVPMPEGVITTIVGTGEPGFSGDGGSAVQAQLQLPYDVAADLRGNIYIADAHNNRIRLVANSGIIKTFAGSGPSGYAGDGEQATAAKLYSPGSVAIDRAGRIYVSDKGNGKVRRVGTDGIITTFSAGGEGLAFDREGRLFVAGPSWILKVETDGTSTRLGAGVGPEGGSSGDFGPIDQARFRNPQDVAFDKDGHLLIADMGNNRIRSLDGAGVVRPFAGKEVHRFTLFPAEPGNPAVGGFAGDGWPAIDAQFNAPSGIAVDALGTVFIADTLNHRIRMVNQAGYITTIAGTGVAGYSGDNGSPALSQLNRPTGLAFDKDGNLLVADSGNHRVRKISFR